MTMSAESVERIYDSYSSFYDLLFSGVLQPGRERAVQALGIRPGDRVLEVGVGTGLSLPYYPSYCEVTGIDLSAAMLKRAEERARELGMRRARLLRMGAERMSLSDASFDRIQATYLLSTVPDPGQVLSEIGRVCRPGGTVGILNHFQSRNRILALGERLLTPLSRKLGFVLDLSLDDVIEDGRFEVESVERVNIPPLWSLVILRRNGNGAAAAGE